MHILFTIRCNTREVIPFSMPSDLLNRLSQNKNNLIFYIVKNKKFTKITLL
jgi:hypothetical protein